VVQHRDALILEVALGYTDSFILVPELGEETGLNVALEKARIDMDRADKSTAFKERIPHAVCSY
jgi:hypothetical protein